MLKNPLLWLSMPLALLLTAGCGRKAGQASADFEARPGAETSVHLAAPAGAGGAGVSFSSLRLDEALAKARPNRGLIMVDVFTDWCGWCKKMDRDVFQDPRVASALKNVIAIKLDAERGGEATARRFGIEGFPTVLFLSSDGKLVKRIDGYVDADRMLQLIASLPGSAG